MNEALRNIQKSVLKIVSGIRGHSFALAGGSALEMFYLKHRFSRDLDFFTRHFNESEIDKITVELKKKLRCPVSKEGEFITRQHARVMFYMVAAKGLERPLKIDFVEDVLTPNPRIKKFKGLSVYESKEIYYHKIFSIAGSYQDTDATGKIIFTGRDEPRDAVDVYYLSRKVQLLHEFLEGIPSLQQRMFVTWTRAYSRMDMKLAVLDLDIYDKKFNVRKMIKHVDDEVEKFIRGVL